MASLWEYAGAGLLSGVGKGMVEQGLEAARLNRETVLEEMRQRGRSAESEKERTFRSDEAEKERTFRGGLLSQTERFIDDQGLMWTRDAGGNVRPVLDPSGNQKKAAMTAKPERLVEVYDEDSPTGVVYKPESEALGKASGKSAEKRVESVNERRRMERDEARAQAEKEAGEKAGWLRSDETDFPGGRAAWTERRTNEILSQRKTKGALAPSLVEDEKEEPADDIKRAFRSGRISREEAIKKLRALGLE